MRWHRMAVAVLVVALLLGFRHEGPSPTPAELARAAPSASRVSPVESAPTVYRGGACLLWVASGKPVLPCPPSSPPRACLVAPGPAGPTGPDRSRPCPKPREGCVVPLVTPPGDPRSPADLPRSVDTPVVSWRRRTGSARGSLVLIEVPVMLCSGGTRWSHRPRRMSAPAAR